ncbi:IS3 family transposase [Bacteroidales bacterium OttesenSCG-928-A14]|nr:IS3 family transposase [Bacteroidales bacterium OttesenSCG-928-A14]
MKERREMVEKQKGAMSVRRQCELLSLHRSGLYYTPSTESDENLEIMRKMDEQYLETPFYGVERLLVTLAALGYQINRKRLRRLMKITGWQTLYPTKRTTTPGDADYKHPYLLRDLDIARANQVWGIDITYIPMKKGFMYLFAIIDLHSRYVAGWSVSNTMTSEWCIRTIKTAIEEHGKPEIINSDQGSQFTCKEYVDFLKNEGITISMDGKGRAIDNVFIERLWRSVKYEHVYLHAYEDGKSLWIGLVEYFKFYNGERPHQSLNYRKPREVYFSPPNESAA